MIPYQMPDHNPDRAEFNWVLQRCQERLAHLEGAIEQEVVRDMPRVWGHGSYWRYADMPDKEHRGNITQVTYKVGGKTVLCQSDPFTPYARYSIYWENVRPIIWGNPWE